MGSTCAILAPDVRADHFSFLPHVSARSPVGAKKDGLLTVLFRIRDMLPALGLFKNHYIIDDGVEHFAE